jgi:hypothetical protein
VRSRTNAIIPAVVVFPCAPATTIESWSDTSSARNSARARPAAWPENAVEMTASKPSGADSTSSDTVTGMPAARTCSR